MNELKKLKKQMAKIQEKNEILHQRRALAQKTMARLCPCGIFATQK